MTPQIGVHIPASPAARRFPVDFGFSEAARVGARVCATEEAQETKQARAPPF